MADQPIVKKPVLFQTQSGLFLGLVCFNPVFESLKFVLEKKEFFDVEWPALVSIEQRGLIPLLLGFSYITVQRSQIIWYTLQIPESLLNHYKAYLPHVFTGVPLKEESLETRFQQSVFKNLKESKKIIQFPFKKDEPDKK
ncbi:MAG: hypothetical protein DRP29_02705 [Thermodesulfobacteriota bacterium]|nr:MAG: hypothetical protein DRP29_02705 [Thermodesulfobacteriota bacterium]RLG11668.1 MAG: hypothetical protein DRN73_04785 [Candidatus Pacearchaeota archaeon]